MGVGWEGEGAERTGKWRGRGDRWAVADGAAFEEVKQVSNSMDVFLGVGAIFSPCEDG